MSRPASSTRIPEESPWPRSCNRSARPASPGPPATLTASGWTEAAMPIPRQWVTTAFTFEGYRVASNRGVVRGITVRSRNIVANIGATIQTLFGGNITLYTELCERAREEAFQLMLEHAAAAGANAIIGMRYDANDVAPGVTEVLAYGTAVVIEPPPPPR